jgi:pimeloyl-ACP methyl ester carboxylesterase
MSPDRIEGITPDRIEGITPDTIVLIHGFWVTPRSWEDWKARYESRGYRVLTPASRSRR